MRRNTIYVEDPPFVLVTLGGAVGTILATSLLYFAPAVGLPLVDVPSLLGGLWSSDPTTALASGYVVFFLGGWLLLPLVMVAAWSALPGKDVGFAGALVKGVLCGGAAWLLMGVVVGAAGALGRVPGTEAPGWFAWRTGVGGAATLLAVHLLYGVAVALVAAMGQGLSPMRAIGWLGHGAGREA